MPTHTHTHTHYIFLILISASRPEKSEQSLCIWSRKLQTIEMIILLYYLYSSVTVFFGERFKKTDNSEQDVVFLLFLVMLGNIALCAISPVCAISVSRIA